MLIKETIKDLRKSKGFTQEEMAKKLSCNRQKIADWERGKSTPSADDLILLSKLFKVSTDYLLGLSDVPTTDKDLQFVCDYMGLDENTVKMLSFNKDAIMLPTSRKHLPTLAIMFMAYDEKKYFKFYSNVFNEFLQSTCLLDIVTNCCTEKVLEHSLNELINFKNEGKDIEKISKYKKEKISMFYEIIKDYFRQHDLNVFNAQKSVVNFLNSITNLNTVEDDEIENIINYITLELYKDKDATINNEYTDNEKKILGYNIDDLDSVSDFMIDRNYSIEDFIEYQKLRKVSVFKSEDEMQEYIIKLKIMMQRKIGGEHNANNPKT